MNFSQNLHNKTKNWLLLDNESLCHIFRDKDLLSNIQTIEDTLVLKTNGGKLRTNKQGYVKGVGWVWYHPDAKTNILSLGLLENKYRVTYNSNKGSVFIVHKNEYKQVRFKKQDNLYMIDLGKYKKNQDKYSFGQS